MTAGRPRKPNELHKLHGTDRADRGTNVLVEIDGELAAEPRYQDFNTFHEKEQFRQIATWVKSLTGQAKVDEWMVSLIVQQYAIYAEAKRDVWERGAMIPTKDGEDTRQNPSLWTMNTALDKIHKLMREFGLTPATRGQVKASNQMDKDPLDDIMGGPK